MKIAPLAYLMAGALTALAQLPAPNAAGVSAGHDIFTVNDLDAANKFWNTLGAEQGTLGPLKLVKFPGVLFLVRKGEHKGGTEGSSIDSIGFKVKNLKESLAKWAAEGVKPMPGGTVKQVFLMGPDDVKVRITEDASLKTPIAADTIEMAVPNVAEAKAWYAKVFGAKPVKDGAETVGDIPGSNIVFVQAKGAVAGTKGRAFDRIGLEVRNLEEFCKKLEAQGIKLDGAYRKANGFALAVALITDPFGTYIEMSDGLAAVQ
jgi:catechol 2,3-dioxygenase-like lactoylglutathione lyase family enzyme